MHLKVFRIIFALLLVALFCCSLASCSENIQNDVAVYDRAEIISSADEQMINNAAKGAKNSRFIVVTHDAKNGDKLYGETVMDELGYHRNDNAVVFVITLSNNTYYCNMYTYGTADRRISEFEVDGILLENDGVIANIKSGNFGAAMSECINLSNSAVEMPWAIIIIIAVVAGAIAGGIAAGTIAAKYKMKLQPTNYPLDKYAKMELTDEDDTFINSRVSVQYISNGSNSRGGSGGSYGGGSGHRGGV